MGDVQSRKKQNQQLSLKLGEQPNCPVCLEPYDTENKTPMVLGRCGHTFCLRCCAGFAQCPICKADKSDHLAKNYALLSVIGHISNQKPQSANAQSRTKKINKLQCPNDCGKIVWNEDVQLDAQSQCAICLQFRSLFICQVCFLRFCYQCRMNNKNKSVKCPTDRRKVQWLIDSRKCGQCELYGPGWTCKKCNFRFCYKCGSDY